jgi:branched-chain amino acid transport system substrate-binding protein
MRTNKTVAWVIALAATGFVAAACSSSASGGAAANGSATGSSAAPIRIGTVRTFSGPLASSIVSGKASVQAWAADVNAHGGINGRQIKLYIEDDAGSDAQGLTAVKKLIEQDHVVAIVGQASGNSAAWASYAKQKGIPVVGGNPGSGSTTTNDDFFAIGGNPLATFYGVSAAARSNGPNLGELYCAELPACANTIGLFQAFGSSTGASLSYSAKVSASAPDFIAPCQGLKDSHVQSYILSLAAATQASVASTCKQQGLNARLLLSGQTADANMLKNDAFDGATIVSPIIPFAYESSPSAKAMHDALREYAPQLGSTAQPLNQSAVQGYISGKLFEAAVKASGATTVTPETVKQGLYALKSETLGGLTVPLTYTQGSPTLFNCFYLSRIKNGQFVYPNGVTPQFAPNSAIDGLLKK